MPEIRPFRALLYNAIKVHFADVVAPAYDAITPLQHVELHVKHPLNIIHLLLDSNHDGYNSATQSLAEWKKQRVLIRDAQPAFYILVQRYKLPDGKQVERKGFIAACRLEELGSGSILPHEKTSVELIEDRLNLLRSTGSMFSQVMGLYSDPRGILDSLIDVARRSIPFAEAEMDGVLNRLWVMRDKTIIHTISEYFRRQQIIIADGHHRYEAACAYRDFMKNNSASATGSEPFNYVPMYFTNMDSKGFVIRPTHRLVYGWTGFNQSDMLRELSSEFQIKQNLTREDMLHELREKKKGAFGVVFPGSSHCSLIWRDGGQEEGVPANNAKAPDLDVNILHRDILGKMLRMTDEQQEQKRNLLFEQDLDVVFDAMSTGTFQVAFLMNPTRIEEVQAAAKAGKVMPSKSTFFYPQLLSGLINYSSVED
jgi:uncharacterized protein (DUF1015 family)